MSIGWHWFVIAGTLLSLAVMMWLLFSNRRTSGKETTGHEWDGIKELDNPLPMWWVWMFIGSTVFALLYLVYYPGLGNFQGTGNWTSANQHDTEVAQHDARFAPLYAQYAGIDSETLMTDRRAMQVGRRLFINNCSTCHGVNATGTFSFPDLTDTEWTWGGDYTAITTTISNGRIAQMPAWGAPLGEQGVANVANYVLKLSDAPHDADAASAGQEQYQLFCVACHGVTGEGNKIFGAPDLTNNIWLYGGNLEQIMLTISEGRQGNMPAQAQVLSEDKIHILATYVRSLSQ